MPRLSPALFGRHGVSAAKGSIHSACMLRLPAEMGEAKYLTQSAAAGAVENALFCGFQATAPRPVGVGRRSWLRIIPPLAGEGRPGAWPGPKAGGGSDRLCTPRASGPRASVVGPSHPILRALNGCMGSRPE